MRSNPNLVSLIAVTKSFPLAGERSTAVFRSITQCLPIDRRMAILGHRKAGKTTLLQMLARKLDPDEGQIIAPQPLSPLANAGGLFHPHLSLLDNIRFIARAYGFAPEPLALAALTLNDAHVDLDAKFKLNDPQLRRGLETATIVALPFACYLIDDLEQLPAGLIDRILAATDLRGAGLIFSTTRARVARQCADALAVIADGALHPFADIEEGLEFFDRHSR